MASWDRRENESAPAYEALMTYLEGGLDRSVNAVSRKLSKSRTLISRWSFTHEWVERARSWDADIERKRLAEAARQQQRRIDNSQRRQRIAGQRAMSQVLKALQGDGISITSAADLYRLAKVGIMLEERGLNAQQLQQKLAVSGDLTETSADKASAPAAPTPDPGGTTLRKLEIEIIGAGGVTVPASEIAAEISRWYEKPGDE